MGAPKPQTLTMILDTGSSTQGIPCHDCEACGHSHWDTYYNRTQSEFNRRMPCGDCSTCRLSTDGDVLRALVPTLLPYVDSADFGDQAAKYLLGNSSMMQCLYNVHYAEGSSLSGLFYTDVIWLNAKPGAEGQKFLSGINDSECPTFPNSPGPSLPIMIPVGCHIEETHLFYDQKASGILGFEFWGNKGVPTFPTATLDALQGLYEDEELSLASCPQQQEMERSQPFHYAFSLCLSPQGGVMSFGGPNTKFHDADHMTLLGTPMADNFRIPLIMKPGKAPSYLIGLKSIKISKKNRFAEAPDGRALYASAFDPSSWDKIELRPASSVRGATGSQETPIVPTLLDSGTTLTYLPNRLFNTILDGIGDRVTANMHLREKMRGGQGARRLQRWVTPETLFSSKTNKVIVIDSPQSLPEEIPDNVVEYIPMSSEPLLAGPKQLVRLSSIRNTDVKRSLRREILEAALPRLPPTHGRKLQDAYPTWYAVLEPSAPPGESKLVGFIDIPHSMEGAPPRALVSKLEGYNNGDCWWLQEQSDDLPLFPTIAFEFYDNVTTVWHPLNYLYSGNNEHFWCLAIMTDEDTHATGEELDDEIIFGSNSFVHHDVVFALEQGQQGNKDPATAGDSDEVQTDREDTTYSLHPQAKVYVIPAFCPTQDLGRRG